MTTTSATDIVLAFCKAWETRDVDQIMAFMTEDCFYENVPMGHVRGTEEIAGLLQSFIGDAKEIDWVVHHIAESPSGVVLTERLDRFLIGDRWLEMRVMGTFELTEGKISAWRDYFDLGQYQKQMADS